MSAGASPPSFEIQGRTVTLPVIVREASTGTATYLVDAAAARKLLPCDEIDVVELFPGRALLSIGVIDYKDNDLGDYDEVSIAFFVREKSRPKGLPVLGTLRDFARSDLATYIHRLPVNQEFTCEAGCRIWGFPKTVDEIDIQQRDGRVHCDWFVDGTRVFQFSVPCGGIRTMPDVEMTTYTTIEGVPHRNRFVSGGEDSSVRLGGARLDLGTHPIADELRALGLPRRALMTTWTGRMHGRFEAPEKL